MTDAEKRDKVIRGLECHATKGFVACQDCPYYPDELIYEDDDDMEGIICEEKLAADAIALLKEQEPRVMTLEELQAIETPWNRNTPPYLWVEGRSATTESRWMSWGFMHDFVRLPGTMGVQNYGSKWRVWTLQPTPEQMRETPWEGEEDHEA